MARSRRHINWNGAPITAGLESPNLGRKFVVEAQPCFSSGKPKEYREHAIQSHRILVVEFSDALAQPRFRHGDEFIDHES